MSKKNQRIDPFDLDDEIDLDFDSILDDVDGVDPTLSDSKSRTPVGKAYKGAIAGLKASMQDPALLERTIKQALPVEYERSFDIVSNAADNVKSIYGDAVKAVKPAATQVVKELDKLIPAEKKRLKGFLGKAKDKLGIYEEYSRKTKSTDEIVNDNITAIFGAQMDAQAQSNAQEKINQFTDAKRFKSSMEALTGINNSLGSLTAYNDKINIAYQKKSLELMYKQYYVQNELLSTTKKYMEVIVNQNNAISRNTALPEFAKLQQSERFKEMMRTKFTENVQSGLFGNGDWIKDGFADIRKKVMHQVEGVKQGLEAGAMGLEAAREARDMTRDMGGGSDGYGMGGEMLGGLAGDQLGHWAGSIGRELLTDNKKTTEFGNKVLGYLVNGQNKLRDFKESTVLREDYGDGAIKEGFKAIGRSVVDSFTKAPDLTLGAEKAIDINQPGIITEQFTNTVNTIIPGYLARIFRELKIIRTGDHNTELEVFDVSKKSFVTKSAQGKSVLDNIKKKADVNWFGTKQNAVVNHLKGEDALSPEAEKLLRERLTDAVFANGGLDAKGRAMSFDDMNDDSFFGDESLDPALVKELRDLFAKRASNEEEKEKFNTETILKMASLGTSVKDVRGTVEKYRDMLGTDTMVELGLVKRNGTSTAIDISRFKNLLKGTDDFDIPEGYRPTPDQRDSGLPPIPPPPIPPIIPPSPVPPPGPSLGSFNTDKLEVLIQKLIDKDCCKEPELLNVTERMDAGLELLRAIEAKMGMMGDGSSDRGEPPNPDQPSSGNGFFGKAGSLAWGGMKYLGRGAKKTVVNTYKTGKFVGKMGGKAASFAGKGFGKTLGAVNKLLNREGHEDLEYDGSLGNTIKNITKESFKLVGNSFGLAKDMLMGGLKALPAGYAQIAKALGWVGSKTIGKALDYINRPKDVYVPSDPPGEDGKPKPRLTALMFQAGEYSDERGKVITTPWKIKGTVYDKDRNIVLTHEEFIKGIYDSSGKKIQGVMAQGFNLAKKVVGGVLGGIGKLGKGVWKAGKLVGKGMAAAVGAVGGAIKWGAGKIAHGIGYDGGDGGGFGSGKTNSILTEIRDILNDRLPAKKKKILGDKDGDGDRDNSWQDQSQNTKKKGKIATKLAAGVERFKSFDVIGMIGSLLKSAGGLVTGFLSSIGNLATSMMGGGILKKLGGFLVEALPARLLPAIGGMFSSLMAGAGSLLSGGIAAAGGLLSTVGGGIVSAGSAAIAAGGAGLAGLSSGAAAAGTALTAAGVATGGVGSMVLGGLGAAATGISAILASPVALGVGAVMLAGYGGYKAYQYFTRDNASNLTLVRLRQYGLAESDEDRYHLIFELEEYLQEEAVGYQEGQAKILESKVDPEEIFDIFSIPAEDKNAIENFLVWFNSRFKPIFLTHLTALMAVDTKMPLEDIDDLEDAKKLKYINAAAFENGPYSVIRSPFTDLVKLSATYEDVKAALNIVRAELEEVVEKSAANISATTTATTAAATTAAAGLNVNASDIAKNVKNDTAAPPEKSLFDKAKEFFGFGAGADAAAGAAGAPGAAGDSEPKLDGNTPQSQNFQVPTIPQKGGPLSDGSNALMYIRKGKPTVQFENLNPDFRRLLFGAIQEYGEKTGKSVQINSTTRNQPGSMHHDQTGLAADINSVELKEMEELGLMRKYGLTRPVGGETWHVELAGTQMDVNQARNSKEYVSKAAAISPGRGGGGYGLVNGARFEGRDRSVAMKSMEDAAGAAVLEPISLTAPNPLPGTGASTTGVTPLGGASGVGGVTPNRYYDVTDADRADTAAKKAAAQTPTGKTSEMPTIPDKEKDPSSKQTDNSPVNTSGVLGIIASAANKVGVPVKILQAMAAIESSLNPNAKASTSSAAGLFQHLTGTWDEQLRKYGKKFGIPSNASPFNPEHSAILGATYLKDNLSYIKSVKSDPTATDGYLAHFLGAGGAKTFLSALASDPNQMAYQVMPKAAGANRPIFYDKGRPRSLKEVYQLLDDKMVKRAKEYKIGVGSSSIPSSDSASSSVPDPYGASSPSSGVIPRQVSAEEAMAQMSAPQQRGGSSGMDSFQPAMDTAMSSGRSSTSTGPSLGDLNPALSIITGTLEQSLTVQKQIYELLSKMAGNKPEIITSVPDIKPKPPARQPPSSTVSVKRA